MKFGKRILYGNPKERIKNPKRQASIRMSFILNRAKRCRHLFADLPEALYNTRLRLPLDVNLTFDFKTNYYPVFVPPHLEGKTFTTRRANLRSEKFLRQLCEEGIASRYTPERLAKVARELSGKDPLEVVKERLSL